MLPVAACIDLQTSVNMTGMLGFVLDQVENIVRKGQSTGFWHFCPLGFLVHMKKFYHRDHLPKVLSASSDL